MGSAAIATLVRMLEALPETAQNQVVEHLREYVAQMQAEMQWDISLKKTQQQLIAAAQRAKQEIGAGHAVPMDYDQL